MPLIASAMVAGYGGADVECCLGRGRVVLALRKHFEAGEEAVDGEVKKEWTDVKTGSVDGQCLMLLPPTKVLVKLLPASIFQNLDSRRA